MCVCVCVCVCVLCVCVLGGGGAEVSRNFFLLKIQILNNNNNKKKHIFFVGGGVGGRGLELSRFFSYESKLKGGERGGRGELE